MVLKQHAWEIPEILHLAEFQFNYHRCAFFGFHRHRLLQILNFLRYPSCVQIANEDN